MTYGRDISQQVCGLCGDPLKTQNLRWDHRRGALVHEECCDEDEQKQWEAAMARAKEVAARYGYD